MLYTSFYNSNTVDKAIDAGRYIVSISRSTPRWLEVDERVYMLAPNKALFQKSKHGMPWDEFKAEYWKQLDASEQRILYKLLELSQKEAILCCWCEDYNECHRRALAEWAEERGVHIYELPKNQ